MVVLLLQCCIIILCRKILCFSNVQCYMCTKMYVLVYNKRKKKSYNTAAALPWLKYTIVHNVIILLLNTFGECSSQVYTRTWSWEMVEINYKYIIALFYFFFFFIKFSRLRSTKVRGYIFFLSFCRFYNWYNITKTYNITLLVYNTVT